MQLGIGLFELKCAVQDMLLKLFRISFDGALQLYLRVHRNSIGSTSYACLERWDHEEICPDEDCYVLDMKEPSVARRAKSLGIRSVPAVVIDGKLADCCTGRGPEESVLRAGGLGQRI